MRLLIIMNLNDSLMRAKLVPLLRSGPVERITVVARRAGPDVPYVHYVVAADRGGALRRTLILLGTAIHAAAQARHSQARKSGPRRQGQEPKAGHCHWIVGGPQEGQEGS